MKQKSISTCLTAFAILGMAAAANSQIVVNENFNRADGNLVGTVPTPGPGGAWAAHSGAGSNPLQILSGQAVVAHGTGSREDANVPFTLQGSGLITASFDITVNATSVIGGGDYEYFAHFSDGGSSAFFGRLDIVPANVAAAGNDFTLGISTTGGAADAVFPTDFSFNTPINVTLSFDWATGTSAIMVGATTVSSTSVASPGVLISAFALRQSTSSNNEQILVDNLVVTQVPEPSTMALALTGLVAGGLVLGRRNRS